MSTTVDTNQESMILTIDEAAAYLSAAVASRAALSSGRIAASRSNEMGRTMTSSMTSMVSRPRLRAPGRDRS
jgi:hypothetical protein